MTDSWKLTMDDITEYKAAFTLFDEDCDGLITIEETKKLMRSLGKYFSEKELEEKVSVFRKDRSRVGVELHEFLDIMAKDKNVENNNEKLLIAFKYFDHTDDGRISFNELSHTLSSLQEKLTPQEIQLLEEYVYLEKDGKFEYSELLNLIIDKGK